MRVLTIKQPWATLIAQGVKRVENRTWRPSQAQLREGDRFGVHAGCGWDAAGAARVGCTLDRRALPRGVIVCTVALGGIVTALEDLYFVGPLGWLLRDVVAATSPQLRGQLGLWHVDDALVQPVSPVVVVDPFRRELEGEWREPEPDR